MISPGNYLIVKKAFWTKSNEPIITIVNIIEGEEVYYKYFNEPIVREREFFDFFQIEIVPLTSLTEQLI